MIISRFYINFELLIKQTLKRAKGRSIEVSMSITDDYLMMSTLLREEKETLFRSVIEIELKSAKFLFVLTVDKA